MYRSALLLLPALLLLGCPDEASDFDGDNFTVEEGDCNDDDPSIYPQAPDVCDGLDNNCDGSVDPLLDRDQDGAFRFHGVLCTEGNDCDDLDPERYPGMEEVCDDVDHDCDGEDYNGLLTWRFLPDADGDGHPVAGDELVLCEAARSPEGHAPAANALDCDDADASTHPGAEELCDAVDHDCDGDLSPSDADYAWWADGDGDGFGAGEVLTNCDPVAPEGFVAVADEDCDDAVAGTFPGAEELCDGVDQDCDGEVAADEVDADGDGSFACDDCDDGSDVVLPGAPELCDGLDNDCDGVGELDGDGDGWLTCSDFVDQGLGLSGGSDCDDAAALSFPGAPEVCDGVDQDCDGEDDEGLDGDGDGVTPCGADGVGGTADDDCDDTRAAVYPGAAELCDGLDGDCDGAVPADEADDDGDGARLCLDCDDADAAVAPGADEVCDGRLNDCDGVLPADEVDGDGDGFLGCSSFEDVGLGLLGGGDCADSDALAFPGAPELCDGADNDCDGSVGLDEVDGDADGSFACADCDDADPEVAPGAEERCDGRLNDCDGVLPADEVDGDGDGYLACAGFVDAGLGHLGAGDCDDAAPIVFPGALELCNGTDDDCDGGMLPGEVDADGDGQYACAECDDTRPEVHLGAEELCDGLDTDCDLDLPNTERDWDGDGYLECDGYVDLGALAVFGGGDCDGFNSNLFPGQVEECDGEDSDCDGGLDEADLDGDGYIACTGFVDNDHGPDGGDDCDDAVAATHPGASEICDALDNDCDGSLGAAEADGDGDGHMGCAECDDADAAIHPDATELCNAVDDNCDAVVDEGHDSDGDGFTSCGGDCDDAAAAVNPSALEICDALDNDCDSDIDAVDGDFVGADFDGDLDDAIACGGSDCDDSDPALQGLDTDGDAESICGGDCDDLDPYVHTGAIEACDGTDTDCDGLVDSDDPGLASDADGDGTVSVGCGFGGSDCDDRDPHVFAESTYTSGLQPDCAPVVRPGFAHEWHHARISLPSYFFDDSTGMHYLYFRAHHDQPQQVIGVAASADGMTWDAPVGPILSPEPTAWDARNLSNATVVRVPSAARPYVMLYHARAASGGLRQIGLASATDPLGPFERIDPMDGVTALTAPVLPPSVDPSFLDSGRTLHPTARFDADSGEIDLWYNGRQASPNTLRIFHASSSDGGVTWTRTDEDAIPGPDPVLEPSEGWEGSSVSQVTWLENPEQPDEFEFWYTGGGNGIGHSAGDEVVWGSNAASPILTASASCERIDGKAVSARGIRYDADSDGYYWYYGAQSDISGVGCVGNEDAIYENGGNTVSYVAAAINLAPEVSAALDGPAGPDLTLSGDVSDHAPDTVVVAVTSDVDGFLGTATVEAGDPSDFGEQTVGWSLSVTGLSSGTHDLFVDAVDEADTIRTVTLSVVVP